MSSWTSIAGSWGAVAGCVVLGWFYYSKDGNQPKRAGRAGSTGAMEPLLEGLIPKKDQKKKPKKKVQKEEKSEAVTSAPNEDITETLTASVKQNGPAQQKKKNGKKGGNNTAQSSSVNQTPAVSAISTKESDTDIRQFAREMAKAKNGTDLSSIKKSGERLPTKKQSKVKQSFEPEPEPEAALSSASSSNNGDADDDLSSVNSQSHSAITSPADTTGIADMLEAPGPVAKSLRITEAALPVKSKPKTIKKDQVVETKKQRQKRLKREQEKEANKEINRAAEAKRKGLEEQQRKTAREAEGRAARNGNGWTYDSGLPANAWSSGQAPAQSKATPIMNGGLLDTTEEPKTMPTILDGATPVPNGKPNGTNGTGLHWDKNLPSEEEQMRRLQEESEESEWTTIPAPKRGKRNNVATNDTPKPIGTQGIQLPEVNV